MASIRRLMVAVSGASGVVYASRLIEILPKVYDVVYLTLSDNAEKILRHELGVQDPLEIIPAQHSHKFCIFEQSDLFVPPASGSHEYEGLVVVPCSMGFVGRIASGVSNDLVTRVADVCLKERRKLVLVVRETPLNLVHLRNLTALAEAGAVILPACPAFYNSPRTLNDAVDFVVDRVLHVLGTDERLVAGWGE